MKSWKIGLSEEKTQCVLYTKKLRVNVPRLSIDDVTVPWKNEAKYLSITFDKRLTWSSYTNNIRTIGYAAIRALYPLLSNPQRNLRCKMQLYTTIIRPAKPTVPRVGMCCTKSPEKSTDNTKQNSTYHDAGAVVRQ